MMDAESAFVAIDVQNDFCPGGALAVKDGDLVVALINAIAPRFRISAVTQDWHPRSHVSFASAHPGQGLYSEIQVEGIVQTLWPDHCVAGSPGASFHPALDLNPYRLILRKGTDIRLDSYSMFIENDGTTTTGLDEWLTAHGIREIWLSGLATDYCVLNSALDAVRSGYRVVILEDAVRAVDVPEGNRERALSSMLKAGCRFAKSSDVS